MRQNLFTIAPDAPFLPTLAEAVLDGTILSGWPQSGPFWLADVTIVLPTRRAQLALADAFAARLGGTALLPDIRTFGGEAGDDEPFLPPLDAPQPLPAAGALERRLVLGRLIAAWAKTPDGLAGFASPPNAAEILWLADSLSGLLDDLTIEGVDAAALRAIAPENLAANWQETLKFLDIVLTAWPHILGDRGKADAATLRNERLLRQALTAPLIYGDKPVIAAGSTGSIPATATLLAALGRLPRGAIVLPGLDTQLTAADVAALRDEGRAPHAHPQYGLVKLLNRLGALPDAVTELAPGPRPPRTAVVRRALALPEGTARWATDRTALWSQMAEALTGLSVLAAPGEDMEARAVAVAARDALARGLTVGIVSPDRNLARRIAAELGRFAVVVDDAAGTPLFQSAAGRLARQALALAANRFAPVDLMSLLRNGATSLGLGRAEMSRIADLVEPALLRGQRSKPGLAGLRQTLADNLSRRAQHLPRRLSADEGDAIRGLFDRLATATLPLCDLLERDLVDAGQLAAALAAAVTAIGSASASGAGTPGADELAAWAEELMHGGEVGPSFRPTGLEAVLAALMTGFEVRHPRPVRDDIAIWGQLEARLQTPGVMILAGLNEDVWPEPADPGPWLSRGMRLAAGLEPPERRHGLAAHDFEMAIGGREVLIAFATRRGASPALPSPLLQRLEAFIGKGHSEVLRARGAKWVEAALTLDAVPVIAPAQRPAPRPPAASRPRKLSITEIETLFRSPYDIYARHVLGLRALDPLGEDPGARERGSIIHAIFAQFIEEGRDLEAPDAQLQLQVMAEAAFAGLDAIGERRDIWLRRFARAAELFLVFERGRNPEIATRKAEIAGNWTLPTLDGFRLTGRADRVDRRHDGRLELIDFKTGSLPKPGDMKAFDAPQLLLEAAMAAAGGFEGIPAAASQALTYIKIGLGPDAFIVQPFTPADGFDLGAAADEALSRTQRHVRELLLSDRLPMVAGVRPDQTRRYRGEFEHLARTDEWTLNEGDDSE